MPHEIPEEKKKQLSDLLMHRNKIEAIKLYREWTGAGLKEAKDDVEEIEDALRKQFPDTFPARGGGCLGMLILFCLCALVLVLWMTKS